MLADVVAVGDVMLDVHAERLEPRHRVHARVSVMAGGSATAAASWAAAAGASAAVVGRIGADMAGRAIAAAVRSRGVLPVLATDESLPTGVVISMPNATVVASRGANERFHADDVPGALVAKSVLISGYALLQTESASGAEAALSRADATWRAVDVGSAALLSAYGVANFLNVVGPANVLLANEEEAALIPDAAERFALVCVKRGSRGVTAVHASEVIEIEPPDVVPRAHAMGTGDAFAGALLAALARGAQVPEAVRTACAYGAAAARDPEPRPLAPSQQ